MKKWITQNDLAREIARMDTITEGERAAGLKEIDAAKSSHVASVIVRMYKDYGYEYIMTGRYVDDIAHRLSSDPYKTKGLTFEEKKRIKRITDKLFTWHWFPLSCSGERIGNIARNLCNG